MLDFSFIISVFNGEKHLAEALSSVAEQCYDSYEVVICNDGSTDGTDKIIRDFLPKLNSATYIENQSNLGLAASLNKCAGLAKGEYLVRMDGDDVCEPDRLKKQHGYICSQGADAVGGCALLIDKYSHIWGARKPALGAVTVEQAFKATPMIHPSTAIRREAFFEVGGYTESMLTRRLEDYDLWLKLLDAGYSLYNADEIFLRYRESSESMKRRRFKYRVDAVHLRREWYDRLKLPKAFLPYVYRPILVGIVPKPLLAAAAKRKAKRVITEVI